MRRYSLLIAFTTALVFAAPTLATAAIYEVDRTGDSLGGACTSALNDCSPREAIQNSNGVPGSTVTVPAGTYTLTLSGAPDDLNFAGDLDQGAGIRLNDGTLSVADSTITDNIVSSATGGGGGIYFIQGTLNIDRTTVSNNSVTDGEGGGIYTGAPAVLTIHNSTISGNSTAGSTDGGGGIYNQDSLTLVNSTISGNSTPNTGGGIDGGPLIVVRNSTISANSAGNGGAFTPTAAPPTGSRTRSSRETVGHRARRTVPVSAVASPSHWAIISKTATPVRSTPPVT